MLRLEKARNKEIHISLRRPERRINRAFLNALAIALSFHLLALVIFRIQSFLHTDETIFLPIMVETDVASSEISGENSAWAYVDHEGISHRYPLGPKMPVPYIPSLPFASIERESIFINTDKPSKNPFKVIEEDCSYLSDMDAPNHACTDLVELHISGRIADLKILDYGTYALGPELKALIKAYPEIASQALAYSVQVESKKGRIFWYAPLVSAEMPVLNKLAERILDNMHFQSDVTSFVKGGVVEIAFNIPVDRLK